MEDIIPLLFSCILISISIIFASKFLKTPNHNFRLPPGPRKLPIIGNLHQLALTNLPPHRVLRELAREHGPIMHLTLGEIPTVVVSSAEAAREVFIKTHEINLVNRPQLLVGKILFYNNGDIALAPYGEHWRQLRKIATLDMFTNKKIQSFRVIREDEVSKLINSLASEAASGSVVNLSDKLFTLIFNITSRAAFSKEGEGQKKFLEFQTELVDILSGFCVADLYPSMKWLGSITGLRRKLEEMVKETDRIIDPIIEEHISKKKQGKPEEDLVDDLLKLHKDYLDDGHTHNPSFSITSGNIKAVILDVFVGGSETSFTLLEWAMSELLRDPQSMEKAQAEVRKVYHSKRMVDESRLNELTFLKLVIKETLRLHCIVPLLLPRESTQHIRVHNYEIPPKTRVMVNAWAIARDPQYWVDPESFKPERFGDSSMDYTGTNFEFVPFGIGRRICPGSTLGIKNVELPLAALLYHFDWKLPTGIAPESLDMDEICGVTLRRKNQLHVIPCVSSSSSTI